MNWLDYREKLKIGFNDTQKIEYFYVKIFNVLDDVSDCTHAQIDENEYFTFCNITGTVMKQGNLYGDGYRNIINVLHNKKSSIGEFLAHYMAFINCQRDESYKTYTREQYKNLLVNMLKQSQIYYVY